MSPNVTLYSDIHLEFDSDFDPGTGDVLVLAGDICVAKEVTQPAIQRFFSKCVAGYNKVFYVLGNHEYYSSDINKTKNIIKHQIPSQITILDNNSVFYDGWHWVGATMWSDFSSGNVLTMLDAGISMNDYNYINNGDHTLKPEDVLKIHTDTRKWFDQVLPTLNGPVFMITHHQPSFKSLQNTYYVRNDISGAYCTELSDFIMKHPSIRYWAAGHVHESQDYLIGNCNVISNPRGYVPYSPNPEFKPNHVIKLKEHVMM